MRKAFEKNTARRRPKLRRAAAVEELAADAPGAAQPVALDSSPAAPPSPSSSQAAGDAAARLQRLEKIRRVVAELAAPAPRVELEKIRRRIVRPATPAAPLPALPARDADTVLSRMEVLAAELARAHRREAALRGELHTARGDLGRAADEPRATTDRLAAAYANYLYQVRQRTRSAQASDQGRPAAAPGRFSSGVAEREARQPELEYAFE